MYSRNVTELCSRSPNIDRLFRKDFLTFSQYIQPKRQDSITKHTQSPIITNDHLISFSDTILVPEAASFNSYQETQSLLQCTQFQYVFFSHFCILKTYFNTVHIINLCGYFNSNISMVCTFTKVLWFMFPIITTVSTALHFYSVISLLQPHRFARIKCLYIYFFFILWK